MAECVDLTSRRSLLQHRDLSLWRDPPVISTFDLFLCSFLGLAVVFDLWERRIPNWLIFLALGAGFLLNAWQGTEQVLNSLWGFGLVIAIFLIPFALGLIGAGDVKLLGAIGALLGVAWVPRVLFYSALAGGLLAALSLATKGVHWTVVKETWIDLKLFVTSGGTVVPASVGKRDAQGGHTIPYGVAIGLGTLVAFYGDPRGYWAGF
jgi:prepilin peptidase CpaA